MFVAYSTGGFAIFLHVIVKFYGAVFRKIPRGLEAAFVAECPGVDLKKHLIDQPRNCPAKNPVATVDVIRWADQVVEALMSIYSMFDECVHGDFWVRKRFGREIFHFLIKSFVLHWFHTERKK